MAAFRWRRSSKSCGRWALTRRCQPSAGASRLDALRELWTGAGLQAVETRTIDAPRSFADFDEFWDTAMLGSSMTSIIASMSASDVAALKERVRPRLPPGADGRVTASARANAVKGRVAR